MDTKVQNFYDVLQFPGIYDLAGLNYHATEIRNPYLELIDRYVASASSLLDVGCGTGYVANLMARRHAHCAITAIDFGQGIAHAQQFAHDHNLTNVKYLRQDFMRFTTEQKFDVVLAQGVLHHIADFDSALLRAKQLVANQGRLILGLYHPWGKILKKYVTIDYDSDILRQDQEHHPYEITRTAAQLNMNGFRLIDLFPRYPRLYALANPIRHSRNGGLVTYVFENH